MSRSRPPARRPRFATVREYGARLGDAAFWRPFVADALRRHGLPVGEVECGAVGTYPTFLVGDHAVKLFGPRFSGGEGYAVERAVHALFLEHPEIPAPALVAAGSLFEGALDDGVPWSDAAPDAGGEREETWPWPYLITRRLLGVAWRDAALDAPSREAVAREIGRAVRRVHALPLPEGAYWSREWVWARRDGCADRHRRWGTLPPHLVEQIDGYLDRDAAPPAARVVAHADLHDAHLFISASAGAPHLAGIIDWGDALACDPHYELPALHCGTFAGDKRLLRAFLDGYGWEHGSGRDFAHRAMSMVLLFEFNVLDRLRALIAPRDPSTLDDLAHLLWTVE